MWVCSKCNSQDVLGGKLINFESDIFEMVCKKCVDQLIAEGLLELETVDISDEE